MEIKTFKGKFLSQWSKLFAILIVLVSWILKIIADAPIEMNDAIKVALFVALMFAPIDISIWIEVFASYLPRKTIPKDGKDDE